MPTSTSVYEFGPFKMDTVRRLLLRDGEVVPLTPKAFDTLLALVENSDRVIEKDELLRTVWPDTVVEERNLTVNISTLRKALGEAAGEHRYIVTIPGRGYRLAAAVREGPGAHRESAVEGPRISVARAETDNPIEPPLPPATEGESIVRISGAVLLSLGAAVVGLAVIVFVYFNSALHNSANKTMTPLRSVAVLPFKPLAADGRDESLEMGMADTLIMRLSNLRQVIVRPISAVRKYGGLDQDPLAAGREQGVDAVLDGSIQRSGERIRVNVRLMKAADGQQLWAGKFEDKFTDIFSVQDSISQRVAAALTFTLSGEEQRQLTKRYTENAEAYTFYLKGRYFASKWTPEGFNKGVENFNKALAIDPNYALAYDGLAYCYYATNWLGAWKDSQTKARLFAQKALQIDDTLAEAHTSLGVITTWVDYDWPSAEKEFQRSFELQPNSAPAHEWYGFLLMALGRLDESVAEAKRAVELDPLSPEMNTALGIYLFYARRYDEARQQLRATIELDPNYWFAHLYLARVYEKDGVLPAAIAELEKARLMEGAPPEVASALGYAYAAAGRKGDAHKILQELNQQSKQMYVAPYNIATVYAGLLDKEKAFEYLEKEYREGVYYLSLLNVDPEVDSLRSDPRFAKLLARVGLAR